MAITRVDRLQRTRKQYEISKDEYDRLLAGLHINLRRLDPAFKSNISGSLEERIALSRPTMYALADIQLAAMLQAIRKIHVGRPRKQPRFTAEVPSPRDHVRMDGRSALLHPMPGEHYAAIAEQLREQGYQHDPPNRMLADTDRALAEIIRCAACDGGKMRYEPWTLRGEQGTSYFGVLVCMSCGAAITL